MKKITTTLTVVAAIALSACNGSGKQQQIELPDLAQMFLSQNFANAQISNVSNDSAAVYEVELSSGTQLQFNSDGMWMKCKPNRAKT